MATPNATPALELMRVSSEAIDQPYRPGNRLTILQNGDEIFPAMLTAIAAAQHTIEFCTYVYWKSDVASQFAQALIERATAGVTVRLLVDAIGGAVMDSRTLWLLERAGVQVAWFRPMRWPYLHKFNNRTHRKIMVVDGRVGFTGGVGIAAEWTGHAHSKHNWRETHCQVEGPACADLHAGFAENWREAARERLPVRAGEAASAGHVPVQTVISTAARHRPTQIEQLFGAVFAGSVKRLWVTTAYFVPSPAICDLLESAAQRGVDVRILTNGALSNHKLTWLAGRASYARLLAQGVRIYEYQATVIHTKSIMIDGTWSSLGSANLDGRSLVHNDELNITFVDNMLTAQLETAFTHDLAQSHEITAEDWSKRSWLDRTGEQSTFLVRGQL